MNVRPPHQTEVALPWYRSLMLWFALSLPALTVVAGVATYQLAAAGSSDSEPDIVRRVAQVQTRDLAADEQAGSLDLQAELILDRNRRHYVLWMQADPAPPSLSLQLRHATLARNDQKVMLERQPDGSWSGSAKVPQIGVRTIVLMPDSGAWRLVGALDPEIGRARLHPLFADEHE